MDETPDGSGGTRSFSSGDLFRRDTGMSTSTSGISQTCPERGSNGSCTFGGQEYEYEVVINSSISGHWARLHLVSSSGAPDVADRDARVAAQPYGSGGWKITRVS